MKLLITILFIFPFIFSQTFPQKYRIIQTSENETQIVSQEKILELIRRNIKFMDITDFPEIPNVEIIQPEIPKKLSFEKNVKSLFDRIRESELAELISTFSSFHTRHSSHPDGVKASEWAESWLKRYGKATLFKHRGFPQPSVIATIKGQSSRKDEIVIIGAHIDSINQYQPSSGRAPGADDDASGCAAVMTIFKILNEIQWKPNRTIEFHLYAAEEIGLRGSQEIANLYKSQGKKVAGMLMMDQTSWKGKDDAIGVLTDYVSPELTQFLRMLVDAYSGKKWKNIRCGYACTDSASWYRAGYAACHPAEAGDLRDTNPYSHTPQDTLDKLDMRHGKAIVQVSLGFAIELAI